MDAFVAMLTGLGSSTGLRVEYTWNAENRLTAVTPVSPQVDDIKVELAYDYMGRRVRKQVCEWGGSEWDLIADTKFVWAGWQLLLELDALDEDAVVRKYTWGLDLAGHNGSLNSLENAGGIGGLLAVHDESEDEDYVYLHDANGNVGQVIDLSAASASAAIKAHYEYDPYGNVVNQTGDYAEENPFRFSTKYFDAETGLGYWGYRYYSPRLGRWLSRDPRAERADALLYSYVHNAPTVRSDPLGLQASQPSSAPASQECCKLCGPDITSHLTAAMTNIKSWFQALPNKDCFCNGIVQAGGWDITDLHRHEIRVQGCPSPSCAGTVWVNGGCWHGGDVNYALWGLLNCLCDRWLDTTMEAARYWKRKAYGQPLREETRAWIGWGFAQGGCGSSPMPKAEWDVEVSLWELEDHPFGFRARRQCGTRTLHRVVSSYTCCQRCEQGGAGVIWSGPPFRVQLMYNVDCNAHSFLWFWWHGTDQPGGGSVTQTFE